MGTDRLGEPSGALPCCLCAEAAVLLVQSLLFLSYYMWQYTRHPIRNLMVEIVCTNRRNKKVDRLLPVCCVASCTISYCSSSLFWAWLHCLYEKQQSDPKMVDNEAQELINLSELQFWPVMSYCLYLTAINVVSDACILNRWPFVFRLLDPGTWR